MSANSDRRALTLQVTAAAACLGIDADVVTTPGLPQPFLLIRLPLSRRLLVQLAPAPLGPQTLADLSQALEDAAALTGHQTLTD